MEKQEIIEILKAENEDAALEVLSAYADNFIDYQEAVKNISEQGGGYCCSPQKWCAD